jgi:hypothetical protein
MVGGVAHLIDREQREPHEHDAARQDGHHADESIHLGVVIGTAVPLLDPASRGVRPAP